MKIAGRGEPQESEIRPERVDVAAGTVQLDVAAIEDRRDRALELRDRIEDAAAAFRTVGLAGPGELVASWAADVDEMAGWLSYHLREIDLARELAGMADVRGITYAEAVACWRAGRAREAAALTDD
jgi:hypothetical protein